MQSAIGNPTLQDSLLIVLQNLSVKDILSVSQTCKLLWRTCMGKQLWLHVWRRDILQEKLPKPTCLASLDFLDDAQTKAIVIHALRLHHNLTCPPKQRSIGKIAFPQSKPITWTRTVDGSCILVASSDDESSVLSLYSIKSLLGARTRDFLAQAFLEGPVLNGLVEVSKEHGIVIALEIRTSLSTNSSEVLSIRNCQGSLKFVRLARYNGISCIRTLRGPFLGFALHDDLSVPSVLDWRTGSVTHLSSRPDIDGGVVVMVMNDDYIAYLTPCKLHVTPFRQREGDEVQRPTIATFALDKTVLNATLAFRQDDQRTSLQVCVTNSDGIFVYNAQIPRAPSIREESQMSLLWSSEIPFNPRSSFRIITQPLVDRTSTTISWLERADYSLVSRSVPSLMRFVTIAEDLSNVRSPLHNSSCFELSERDMPALYAMSTRDYDQGLGLLVIGNMIGELTLYSLSGDAFSKMQGALRPLDIHSWTGEELLPLTTIPSFPPAFPWERGRATEADKQAYQHVWNKYYPQDLNIPKNWDRCSPYDCIDELRFLDDAGNTAWELNNLCHFLGRVVPLIQTQDGSATLLSAGGLFLMYHTEPVLAEAFFAVLNPALSLAEIVGRLPEEFTYGDELGGGVVVRGVVPDGCAALEAESNIRLLGVWEQRHGIDRWGRFRARGGKAWADWQWTHVEEGPLPNSDELRCCDECPLCV